MTKTAVQMQKHFVMMIATPTMLRPQFQQLLKLQQAHWMQVQQQHISGITMAPSFQEQQIIFTSRRRVEITM